MCFIYAVLFMTQQLLPFPDRSRGVYTCNVVWGYFPSTGILQYINITSQEQYQNRRKQKNQMFRNTYTYVEKENLISCQSTKTMTTGIFK